MDDKVNYGIDVHQRYDAHLFDFETKAIMDKDIRISWKEKYGWIPPSEKKEAA